MRPVALSRSPKIPLADRFALTKPEAAQSVGCSERLLGIEEAAGRLKVIRVGRKWLVRPSDLEAWLDARAAESKPKQAVEESAARPETDEEPVDRPELPRRNLSPGVEHSDEKTELDPAESADHEIEAVNQADPPSQLKPDGAMSATNSKSP